MSDVAPIPPAAGAKDAAAVPARMRAENQDTRAGDIPPSLRAAMAVDPAAAPVEPGAPPVPGEVDAAWPEDWRARLARGDQRLARRLERFASPRTIVDSLLAAEQRLRGGDGQDEGRAVSPPDAAADPDRLAAWRAEQGIPASPADYELDLPDGMLVGEADQPLVDGFLASAHRANMTPDQVNRALGWYYRQHDELAAELARGDAETHRETVAELRQAWGGDYKASVNVIDSFLDDAPEGVKANLLGARLADGTLLGDSVPALRWLHGLARNAYAASTLAPGAEGGPGKALGDEIAAIERRMAHDRDAYFKDEAAQARYRELVAARDRGGAR